MRRLATLAAALALVTGACGGTTSTTTTVQSETDGTGTTIAAGTTAPSTTAAAPGASVDPTDTAPPPDTAPPSTAGATIDPEITRFASGDDFLEATVWRGGPVWIVLGHMYPADRTSWVPVATGLQAAGYSVLAYDNRGYGGSTGPREPFALLDDARAALEFARAEGAEGVVYGGASMNGATAMIVGATEDVAALFMLSAVGSFPSVDDAESHLADIEVHVVYFAARDDGSAVDDADRFRDATPLGESIFYETGGHGTDMLGDNPQLLDQVLFFLEQYVG